MHSEISNWIWKKNLIEMLHVYFECIIYQIKERIEFIFQRSIVRILFTNTDGCIKNA